ncbi:MAG: isocitrate lyase [Candidatus Obscuribacterales bacterium]|jgi:isocitrate lyase|nr:isocitrate lyase [Candidatus Obscuribacterales bacterium]
MEATKTEQVRSLEKAWAEDARWQGIQRNYAAEDVVRLRGSVQVEFTLAKKGAEKFWQILKTQPYITALGAMNGSQAVQMVRAGLKSIYLSGWQVAADANSSKQTYPDQSLYPSNSVPELVKRLNNSLMRADQIDCAEDKCERDWFVPIMADAEAGFGGPVHAFELMKSMIESGASGVHFEDQLASEKKCGHLGGKVLVPTSQFIRTLSGARLAADVLGVPTIIVARTDALDATLLTSDIDPIDREFITGERTPEGYFRVKSGIAPVIARALAYAPYADLLWFESSRPDLEEAKQFAEAIHAKFPGKMLAYNCSPSFNWKQHLDDKTIESFNAKLGELGFKYQFITLAGWHATNLSAFQLAEAYAKVGMPAYVQLQEEEFANQAIGYTAVRHQREVGTGYFDKVLNTISGGQASTSALVGSTEEEQFASEKKPEAKELVVASCI